MICSFLVRMETLSVLSCVAHSWNALIPFAWAGRDVIMAPYNFTPRVLEHMGRRLLFARHVYVGARQVPHILQWPRPYHEYWELQEPFVINHVPHWDTTTKIVKHGYFKSHVFSMFGNARDTNIHTKTNKCTPQAHDRKMYNESRGTNAPHSRGTGEHPLGVPSENVP